MTAAAFGLLGDHLLGFTDIVRGTFSRNDKSALPDCDILVTSTSAQADDGAVNVRATRRRKRRGLRRLQVLQGLLVQRSSSQWMTRAMTQGLRNALRLLR